MKVITTIIFKCSRSKNIFWQGMLPRNPLFCSLMRLSNNLTKICLLRMQSNKTLTRANINLKATPNLLMRYKMNSIIKIKEAVFYQGGVLFEPINEFTRVSQIQDIITSNWKKLS